MKKVHIYAYGDVMNFQSAEAGEWGVISLKMIMDQIKANPDAEEIVVHIHSGGGDVYEGFAIHDALITSGKKITTIIEGLCASIATVIALAGSTRQMTPNSEFMIHNPWSFGFGTADELEKQAEFVRTAENKLSNFYVDKTKQSLEDIQAMMNEETFMSPEKAKELGFITEILSEPTQARFKVAAKMKPRATGDIKKQKPNNMKKTTEKDKKTALDKVKTILAAVGFTFDAKDLKAKKEDVKNALTLKTTDGKEVVIESDATDPVPDKPMVGDTVTVDGEAAPNATLNIEDGTVIETDDNSVITAVESAEEEQTEPDAASKAKIEELEKANAKLKKENDVLLAAKNDGSLLKAANKKVSDLTAEVEKLKKENEKVVALNTKKDEAIVKLTGEIKSLYVPEEEDSKFTKKEIEEAGGEGVIAAKGYLERKQEAKKELAKKVNA